MRLLIINGPNMNMLKERDNNIYGSMSLKEINRKLKEYAIKNNIKLKFYQSNTEGKIINFIQKNYKKSDGIIINPAAYTHYSYAIRDALELTNKDIIEVHMSDVLNREEFRKISVLEGLRKQRFIGKGIDSYFEAIKYFQK